MRAAIYCRISADPEGRSLGVQRQEADCRALAARLGLEIAQVFVENDLSASPSSTKRRPLYDELVAGARAGRYEAIIAYSNSRLTRRPREVEDLIDLATRHHVRLHTVVSGEDDLSTADGRMVARIKGNVDAAEAERTSERATRAKRQAAADGRHRGGPRPFGWDSDGMTVRPDEARLLLDASRAVLAGRTLAAIAREWNASGVTTSTGRPWTYAALRTALCRPRNAGLVSHGRADRGEMVIVGPARWPAVVPEDVWRATRLVLMDPARRGQNGTDLRWLGSGVYRCGLCGGAMRVAPYRTTSTGRHFLYRCTTSAHLTFAVHEADEAVRAVVRAQLGRPEFLAGISAATSTGSRERSDELRERREALMARLATFEADYAAGLVTGEQLATATRTVQAQVAGLDSELVALVGGGPLASIAHASDAAAAFDAAPLDAQRAIVDALMTVTIAPSGRGRKLGAERVRIAWKA